MTDEELAEKYVRNATNYSDGFVEEQFERIKNPDNKFPIVGEIIDIYEAFLAGLEAGRPKWHDLRKDPNDLPKVNDQYWVCYEDSVNIGRKGNEMWSFINGKWEHTAKVIAWCEMPKCNLSKLEK